MKGAIPVSQNGEHTLMETEFGYFGGLVLVDCASRNPTWSIGDGD